MEAVWSLISQGLAYVDYSQPASENWRLILTDAGRAASVDEAATPDDPAGYLERIGADVPTIAPIVKSYVEEAVGAYTARLYRASTVMLGVASEAAVLDVSPALAQSMTTSEADNYLREMTSRKNNFTAKFSLFAQKLRSKKDALPPELSDGLELTIHAVTDLLRLYRNDAGHPTGRQITRSDCFIHLRMFVRYAQKLYSLKAALSSK